MQNLGANNVYYGRNAIWELSFSYDVMAAILVFQTMKNPLCSGTLFLCKSFHFSQ